MTNVIPFPTWAKAEDADVAFCLRLLATVPKASGLTIADKALLSEGLTEMLAALGERP